MTASSSAADPRCVVYRRFRTAYLSYKLYRNVGKQV